MNAVIKKYDSLIDEDYEEWLYDAAYVVDGKITQVVIDDVTGRLKTIADRVSIIESACSDEDHPIVNNCPLFSDVFTALIKDRDNVDNRFWYLVYYHHSLIFEWIVGDFMWHTSVQLRATITDRRAIDILGGLMPNNLSPMEQLEFLLAYYDSETITELDAFDDDCLLDSYNYDKLPSEEEIAFMYTTSAFKWLNKRFTLKPLV